MDIKGIRRKMGMTQESFSQILNTSVCEVSRWELKKNAPKGAALEGLKRLEILSVLTELELQDIRQKLLVAAAVRYWPLLDEGGLENMDHIVPQLVEQLWK